MVGKRLLVCGVLPGNSAEILRHDKYSPLKQQRTECLDHDIGPNQLADVRGVSRQPRGKLVVIGNFILEFTRAFARQYSKRIVGGGQM